MRQAHKGEWFIYWELAELYWCGGDDKARQWDRFFSSPRVIGFASEAEADEACRRDVMPELGTEMVFGCRVQGGE